MKLILIWNLCLSPPYTHTQTHNKGEFTPQLTPAWPFNCHRRPDGAVIHNSIGVRQNTRQQSDSKAFTESAHLLEMMLPSNKSLTIWQWACARVRTRVCELSENINSKYDSLAALTLSQRWLHKPRDDSYIYILKTDS